MMKGWICALLILATLISSCARPYRPVIDPAMIRDQAKYERDLAECGALASEQGRSERVGTGAVGGGLWGAIVGTLLGWIGGRPGTGAAAGAVVGAATGAASGAGAASQDYETIYRNCMIARGWPVLQ
jgi:uncharacterized protein YcfJ